MGTIDRGQMGALFDSLLVLIFLVLTIARISIVGRFLKLSLRQRSLLTTSILGFTASLFCFFFIFLALSYWHLEVPFIMVLAGGFLGSIGQKLFSTTVTLATILILILPCYFTERYYLAKSSLHIALAKKTALYASISLGTLIIGLILAMFAVAMCYF